MDVIAAALDEELFAPRHGDDPRTVIAHYARAGLRVFPVHAGKKEPPPGFMWKARATSNIAHAVEDADHACAKFGEDLVSIAWACGLDGYLALDLDADEPAWWSDLEQHGAINRTRRGRHLIFPFPDGLVPGNSTSRFPTAGWGEARGVGGYIVIAGPDRPGFDVRQLRNLAAFPRPEWLTPSDDTQTAATADEVRDFLKSRVADNQPAALRGIQRFLDDWAPGKTRPNGKQYEASRHVTAVATACWIAREASAGKFPAKDGFDVLARWWIKVQDEPYRAKLDGREWKSIVAWGVANGGTTVITSESAAQAGEASKEERSVPNVSPATAEIRHVLPDGFWRSRPVLTHIRQAAWSRMVAPDAALNAVLARYAALVPPTVRLPAIIGSEATFDYIGCNVATSAGGKSIAGDTAVDLLPSSRTDVLLELPVGSGEGLVQSFFVPERGDDGKPTGHQIVGYSAVHFTIDEGTALLEQSSRNGTTIVQTLCSAWSGRGLGQTNAKAETRRIIAARRVRVAAVLNLQTRNGHLILNDKMMAIGLPQRITFASAHDPSLPAVSDLPEWPGPLQYTTPAAVTTGTQIDVHDEIVAALRNRRHAIASGAQSEPELDGHVGLMRLKIGGLLALLDTRMTINSEDWALAGMVVDNSIRNRDYLVIVKQADDTERRRKAADGRADFEARVDDVKELKAVARLTDSIIRRTSNAGKEGIGRADLKRNATSATTRHRFDDALNQAIGRGAIRDEAGRVYPI
jgi:hypothetical protein